MDLVFAITNGIGILCAVCMVIITSTHVVVCRTPSSLSSLGLARRMLGVIRRLCLKLGVHCVHGLIVCESALAWSLARGPFFVEQRSSALSSLYHRYCRGCSCDPLSSSFGLARVGVPSHRWPRLIIVAYLIAVDLMLFPRFPIKLGCVASVRRGIV